jgi:S1-C subfamily serine protease
MKKLKLFLLTLLLIPCFFLGGCDFLVPERVVTDISKSGVNGNIVTYTITYSDGSTSNFSVENGEDGQDLTLEVIQAYCNKQGITLEEYFNSLDIELNSIEKATNLALKSAVTITAVSPYQTGSQYMQRAGGAGVIYKMDEVSNISYIITNYHVVSTSTTLNEIANEIKIFQYGADMRVTVDDPDDYKQSISGGYCYKGYNFSSSAVDATYIGGSNTFDIAILQVETDDLLAVYPHARPITVAKNYSVANTAIAIGNPNATGMSVTKGIVSVESENLTLDGIDYRVMRIDTPVNPGNSGGGLFNDKGELIGIVNAKMESTKIDNIAYAIPFDNAILVADNIIDNSCVKKLYLGISYATENSHAVYDANTKTTLLYDELVIKEVDAGSVGEAFGLQVDDKITKVIINTEIHTIRRSFQLADLLLKVRVGDSIAFYGTRIVNQDTVENYKLGECNSVLANQLKVIE